MFFWEFRLTIMLCLALVSGCGEKENKWPDTGLWNGLTEEERPQGTWFMYGSSDTGFREAEEFNQEITILTLGDSLYSLTLMKPDIQFSFTETGKVDYDYRRQLAKFTVLSLAGVDFSGTEPRKLVDISDFIIWQRDPGHEYIKKLETEVDYMKISSPDTEDSYFARMKAGEELGKYIDIKVNGK